MRKPRENGLPRNKGCGKVAVRRRAGAGPENLMAKLFQVFFKIGVSEMEDFHGTVREIFGQIFYRLEYRVGEGRLVSVFEDTPGRFAAGRTEKIKLRKIFPTSCFRKGRSQLCEKILLAHLAGCLIHPGRVLKEG